MTLTASRTSVGFEKVGNLLGIPSNPRKYELTPGSTFDKGQMVYLSAGKVTAATTTANNILGVMAEKVAATANTTGTVTYGYVYDNPFDEFRVTFTGHIDGVVETCTAANQFTDATYAATTADDTLNGALLYIYEGPGKGDIRTVSDYETATALVYVDKNFSETLTTNTKYICLAATSGAAVGDSVNVGTVGVELEDSSAMTINVGACLAGVEPGPLVIREIYPADLMARVMIRKHLYNGDLAITT